MNAVSNEKRPTSMALYIRPTGSRGFKVHNVITCESKVQVVVSLGRHWVLFALGHHWVLTNGTWHILLQSGNVFELRGITIEFITREWEVIIGILKWSRGEGAEGLEPPASQFSCTMDSRLTMVFHCQPRLTMAGSVMTVVAGHGVCSWPWYYIANHGQILFWYHFTKKQR